MGTAGQAGAAGQDPLSEGTVTLGRRTEDTVHSGMGPPVGEEGLGVSRRWETGPTPEGLEERCSRMGLGHQTRVGAGEMRGCTLVGTALHVSRMFRAGHGRAGGRMGSRAWARPGSSNSDGPLGCQAGRGHTFKDALWAPHNRNDGPSPYCANALAQPPPAPQRDPQCFEKWEEF